MDPARAKNKIIPAGTANAALPFLSRPHSHFASKSLPPKRILRSARTALMSIPDVDSGCPALLYDDLIK
jgi:hypothetical protein